MGKLYVFGLFVVVGACAPSKTPVEQLTFEQKAEITKACEANGKIATDDYCKEVAVVYYPEYRASIEKKSRDVIRGVKSYPKMPW